MPRRARQTPSERRRVLRSIFESNVGPEWRRYAGVPRRRLSRALRERFLALHLPATSEPVLEVGPGPGRFTPIARARARGRLIELDLSRRALVSGRRRAGAAEHDGRTARLQAAAEHLPLRDGSVGALVGLGNIVGMASRGGPGLFAEWARVVRPGGRLVVDFGSPSGAVQEFLYSGSQRRFLGLVLRDPNRYFVDQVLTTGFQPHAPERWARWEFRFYTVAEVRRELGAAGFRVVDAMSVAPLAAFQDRVAAIAAREPRTWAALLKIEEAVGRRPGTLETGHGFVVAAIRDRRRPRATGARGRGGRRGAPPSRRVPGTRRSPGRASRASRRARRR